MTTEEKSKLIELAKKVAQKGGKVALSYFRKLELSVNSKTSKTFDPVTDADLAAEDVMRSHIKENRPDDTIIGEEREVDQGSSGFVWYLDPIDGTRAFISGIPVWTVLVSVSKDGHPILGVIYQPFNDELFVGGLGLSEYMRRSSSMVLSTKSCESLNSALLSSTFPEIGTAFEKRAFDAIVSQVQLCRYGLDAYAYALLAAGHLDIVVEAGLKPHDTHAPIAVIEAAGGFVTSWDGGPATHGGRVLACGDKLIHEAALEILSKEISSVSNR